MKAILPRLVWNNPDVTFTVDRKISSKLIKTLDPKHVAQVNAAAEEEAANPEAVEERREPRMNVQLGMLHILLRLKSTRFEISARRFQKGADD